MTTPTKTLDQAVYDIDKKEFWSARRTNFTKFRIDSSVVARHTSNPVLLVGKDAKISGEYEIPVNNMGEFNFKTKKEIYDLRKQRVFEHSNLVASYVPSEAVFGHIVDKIPWWGIYGIYGYGTGIKSIEGPSEESRFLLNPYLLVGLSELNAFITPAELDRTSAFYPKPIRINLRADASSERIEYLVSDHFHYVNSNHVYPINQQKLSLITYNARDMGFSHLYIDPKKSDGLTWVNKNKSAVPILDYIHRGTSCGFPETGCNNASPFQQDLVIEIEKIPAKAHVKLWRTNPQNVDNDCDMTVIIEMQ